MRPGATKRQRSEGTREAGGEPAPPCSYPVRARPVPPRPATWHGLRSGGPTPELAPRASGVPVGGGVQVGGGRGGGGGFGAALFAPGVEGGFQGGALPGVGFVGAEAGGVDGVDGVAQVGVAAGVGEFEQAAFAGGRAEAAQPLFEQAAGPLTM